MENYFSIIGRLDNIIKTLKDNKNLEAMDQLETLRDDIDKYNTEKQLNYMNELENDLK